MDITPTAIRPSTWPVFGVQSTSPGPVYLNPRPAPRPPLHQISHPNLPDDWRHPDFEPRRLRSQTYIYVSIAIFSTLLYINVFCLLLTCIAINTDWPFPTCGGVSRTFLTIYAAASMILYAYLTLLVFWRCMGRGRGERVRSWEQRVRDGNSHIWWRRDAICGPWRIYVRLSENLFVGQSSRGRDSSANRDSEAGTGIGTHTGVGAASDTTTGSLSGTRNNTLDASGVVRNDVPSFTTPSFTIGCCTISQFALMCCMGSGDMHDFSRERFVRREMENYGLSLSVLETRLFSIVLFFLVIVFLVALPAAALGS